MYAAPRLVILFAALQVGDGGGGMVRARKDRREIGGEGFASTGRSLRGSARARCAFVVALVVIGCAAWAPQALAEFPFLGKGTLSEPASWRLAPGETVTNLGGELTQHFGGTPATPPASEPVEAAEITKLNSQTDELCGVMGMSITDPNATMPAGTGSCVAAGTPIHTAFDVTVGRPDVSIAELDSGIER